MGDVERMLSAMGGGALALAGLRRRGPAGAALAALGAHLVHRGATGYCRVYDRLGVSTADSDEADDVVTSAAATVNARQSVKVEDSVTIRAARPDAYAYWRNFDNHPRFMSHLRSVTPQVDGRFRYEVELPGGARMGWTSELVRDIPGELISWKTVGDSDLAHAGSVVFRDTQDGLGTRVTLTMDYEPIGGRAGHMLAKLRRLSPEQIVRRDLERFRTVMETGEKVR